MMGRLYVVTKYFMSRQNMSGWEDFLLCLSILCHDRVGQVKEKLCCNRAIICRDIVDLFFFFFVTAQVCRDREIFVAT